ncbi:hypothetical protein MPSEU_000771900 [Mayamaea pseudoterrestris]|nr:hypothetical protein MPSEU_000771900 [Mayamaea pseudoterrestris]
MTRLPTTISSWLLAASLFAQYTSATITMTDTGQRFRSTVDSHLGKPLWTGYDYYARLQYLPLPQSNGSTEEHAAVSNLCSPPAITNLTVPADGLPVALLVQGGGCSTQQKINVALQYIQPASLLRFLIINDINHHEDEPGRITNIAHDMETSQEQIAFVLEQQHFETTSSLDSSVNPASVRIPPAEYAFPKQDFNGDDLPDKIIPLHVLHITNPVYEQLLNVYLLPDAQTLSSGGPRVTIDGTSGSSYFGLLDNSTALWISLFAICAACACTVLILVGNSMNQSQHDWEEWNRQQQVQQQQQRRQRRRLTREQIRKLLPQYRYDGLQLNLVLQQSAHDASVGKQQQGLGGGIDDENAHLRDALLAPPSSLPPSTLAINLELDCCSVCLDDYEVNDKVRVLPCHHCFHSRCVGRWLAERSATCPLCKTELWAEEDIEEAENEREQRHEEEIGRPAVDEDSIWNRIFFGALSRRDQAADGVVANVMPVVGTEQEMTALQPRQESAGGGGLARAVRHSWLRRILPSHAPWAARTDEEAETAEMLTEPLLADEETGQAGVAITEGETERREISLAASSTREEPVEVVVEAQNQSARDAQEETVLEADQHDEEQLVPPLPAIAEPTDSPPRQVSV